MELTWTGVAAGLSLMWVQSTPSSQARLLRSSTLCTRSSLSLQNLQATLRSQVRCNDVITSGWFGLLSLIWEGKVEILE